MKTNIVNESYSDIFRQFCKGIGISIDNIFSIALINVSLYD